MHAAPLATPVSGFDRERHSHTAGTAAAVAAAAACASVAVASSSAATCSERATAAADAPTLYQYEVCPWCNKAKAVLDYKGVPYHAVEVHPLFKSEIKWSEYRKVPILLLADGQQVNESNKIVDMIFEQPASDEAPPKRGRVTSHEGHSAR